MSITESPSRASAALVREVRDCRALPGDVDHGIEDRFGPRMAMISGHLFRSATSIRDDDMGVVASALADALYLVYVTPASWASTPPGPDRLRHRGGRKSTRPDSLHGSVSDACFW